MFIFVLNLKLATIAVSLKQLISRPCSSRSLWDFVKVWRSWTNYYHNEPPLKPVIISVYSNSKYKTSFTKKRYQKHRVRYLWQLVGGGSGSDGRASFPSTARSSTGNTRGTDRRTERVDDGSGRNTPRTTGCGRNTAWSRPETITSGWETSLEVADSFVNVLVVQDDVSISDRLNVRIVVGERDSAGSTWILELVVDVDANTHHVSVGLLKKVSEFHSLQGTRDSSNERHQLRVDRNVKVHQELGIGEKPRTDLDTSRLGGTFQSDEQSFFFFETFGDQVTDTALLLEKQEHIAEVLWLLLPTVDVSSESEAASKSRTVSTVLELLVDRHVSRRWRSQTRESSCGWCASRMPRWSSERRRETAGVGKSSRVRSSSGVGESSKVWVVPEGRDTSWIRESPVPRVSTETRRTSWTCKPTRTLGLSSVIRVFSEVSRESTWIRESTATALSTEIAHRCRRLRLTRLVVRTERVGSSGRGRVHSEVWRGSHRSRDRFVAYRWLGIRLAATVVFGGPVNLEAPITGKEVDHFNWKCNVDQMNKEKTANLQSQK